MATERVRTVKSSGGDYPTLSAWEAGEQADIVALDEIRTAECYSFEDTTSLIISGWTTDATRFIKVTTPTGERHDGKWNASKYRMSFSGVTGINFNEPYVYLEGIQFQMSESGSTARTILLIGSVGAGNIYIDKCILRQNPASAGTGSIVGFANSDAATTVVIRNTLFYDFRQGTGRGVSVNPGLVFVLNCTAHNCDEAFRRASGTITARNCLANDSTDGFVGTFDAASNYNASDVASDAPGANSRNGASGTASFVDEAGDDFHLASGDTNCKDLGEDLSGATHGFTDDVDGNTRSGSWDIGFDEIASAGGSATGTGTPSLPGSGVASHPGSGSPTLSVVTGAGTGVASHPGSGSPNLSAITSAGDGIASHPGSGAPSVPGITLAGSGVASHPGSGTPTLPAITAAGSGANGKSGEGALSLSALLSSGAGISAHPGLGALSIPGLTLAGVGTVPISGTGALSIPGLSLAGVGAAAHIAAGVALTLSSISVSGTGSAVVLGVETSPLHSILVQLQDLIRVQMVSANHLQIQVQSSPPFTIDLNHP
jgi:hypothetical protein